MTLQLPQLRLQSAWKECERHVHHMFHAMWLFRALWPLTAERYATLTDDQIQTIDQFILRFTKLQDVVGGRLFPALLQYLEEPYDDRPMLDKLHRLEKLGFIESTEKWQRIRDIRNKFAHDYPDDMEKNAEYLNLACEAALDLHDILHAIPARLTQECPEMALGKALPENIPEWIRQR